MDEVVRVLAPPALLLALAPVEDEEDFFLVVRFFEPVFLVFFLVERELLD
ncbi:MAG: hypothetical protein Tsb0013_15110 [Phycisphaerales bacterium]